jgi:aspartyl-tRNA(Asn)/glutamyl-tRNA(Gln) amidotransferase subunit A
MAGRARFVTEARRTGLCDLPLLEVAGTVARRDVSPVELTTAVLERIAALEPTLNAFISVLEDRALARARQAEAEIAAGAYRGPLHGIPVSVKDLFATAGVRTTAGSRVLADHVPTEDATVVRRLDEAGAVLIGKTNMLEFAYAAVHDDYGPSPNPWELARSASGSSSGSAVAVAAGMGYASVGSDTDSIRLPAAWCGIVGLKPTYGRVSRHGGIPVSWSADHFGPMTRTVADCAAVLAAIAGEDARDPTAGRVPVPDYFSALERGVRGLRIGIADSYLRERVRSEVRALVEAAIARFEALGATIETIPPPPPAVAVPALLAILMPEATAYHLEWLRERPHEFSPAVRERLELGAVTPAVSYIQAQRVRRRFIDEMLAALAGVDLLLTPTGPTAAPLLEGDLTTGDEADPEGLAALIAFTGPFNLTGQPAISIPCGITTHGLPVGLQLVGRPYEEEIILAAAHAYEQSTDWHTLLPTAVREAGGEGREAGEDPPLRGVKW